MTRHKALMMVSSCCLFMNSVTCFASSVIYVLLLV